MKIMTIVARLKLKVTANITEYWLTR